MHPMCIQTRKLPASQYHPPSHVYVGLPVTILTADFASGTNINVDTLGLGVMAGVCGLRMLHGRNRTLTKKYTSLKTGQNHGTDRYRHTHDRRRRFLQGAAY